MYVNTHTPTHRQDAFYEMLTPLTTMKANPRATHPIQQKSTSIQLAYQHAPTTNNVKWLDTSIT